MCQIFLHGYRDNILIKGHMQQRLVVGDSDDRQTDTELDGKELSNLQRPSVMEEKKRTLRNQTGVFLGPLP